MQIAVIIPAAGVGSRFADRADPLAPAAKSKLEADLGGRPIFVRSIELFTKRPEVVQIILAVHPDKLEAFKLRYGDRLALFDVTIVAGGKIERWETVLQALKVVRQTCTHVAVHDAARPLASTRLIDRVFGAAEKLDAVLPGYPVNSTLKKLSHQPAPTTEDDDPMDAILGSAGKFTVSARCVSQTVDRTDLIEAQTPQVFRKALLQRAYQPLAEGKIATTITDDASLVEQLGEKVYVVEGEAANLKITRPEDMQLAEAYLQMRTTPPISKLKIKNFP